MERLKAYSERGELLDTLRLWRASWTWELYRTMRVVSWALGLWGWGLLCTVTIGTTAVLVAQHYRSEIVYRQALKNANPHVAVDLSPSSAQSRREDIENGIHSFERILLPVDEIPQSLSDLLNLAKERGLSIPRAEYQTSEDAVGGFMRYRMVMPIKGNGSAINRYMQAALKQHKYLLLESATFSRDDLNAPDLDAKIQWVFLTQLPGTNSVQKVLKR